MDFSLALALMAGTLFGSLVTGLVLRARLEASRARSESVRTAELATLQERLIAKELLLKERDSEIAKLQSQELKLETTQTTLAEEVSRLQERLRSEEEKLTTLQDFQNKLTETFKSLSSDALRHNNQSFLELATQSLQRFQESAKGDLEKRQGAIEQLVKPLHESLQRVDSNLTELEKTRLSSYAALDQHLKTLTTTQGNLLDQTSNLVKALRTPNVRGRWGEIQLQRVVEMAGMVEYCDFVQQESRTTDEKQRLRPDLIVRLPGGKNVIVDAKAPLQAYLEALDAKDDTSRQAAMIQHARQIRDHIGKLGQKSYQDEFGPSPEFVVLFLPGENFFSAALENDPQLIEIGVEQKVILATPTTLIALLRAVSYGWRHEQLTQNAEQISQLGRDLYDRISVFASHYSDIKKGIDKTVESYNKGVASLETRVLVSARKIRELGGSSGDEIDPVEAVDHITRDIQVAQIALNSK